jgi:hypothetical protein
MTRLLILWTKNFNGHERKVQASTMVEAVVSLTILLTILTLSFVYLDRINRSLNPSVQYKAHLVTNEVLNRDDLLLGEVNEYEVNGLIVKKRLIPLLNGVYGVELTVLDGYGKPIYVRKILKSNEIIL